jgi:hypothetical protein
MPTVTKKKAGYRWVGGTCYTCRHKTYDGDYGHVCARVEGVEYNSFADNPKDAFRAGVDIGGHTCIYYEKIDLEATGDEYYD